MKRLSLADRNRDEERKSRKTVTLDLDAIEARTNAATPAPWSWPMCNGLFGGSEGEEFVVAAIHDAGPVSAADAQFIANARTDVPALIAEIRKLRAQLHDAGLPDGNDFPHPHGGIL
jgi:hypothetical protein